jgi:hypothetical protein
MTTKQRITRGLVTGKRLARDLQHAGTRLHHLLSGPDGPIHAAVILGLLVGALVVVSYFSSRTGRD